MHTYILCVGMEIVIKIEKTIVFSSVLDFSKLTNIRFKKIVKLLVLSF